MTSTYLTLNRSHQADYHATTLSTYGLNYFNDNCSTSDYSDGYQSSISPVASPSSQYFAEQQHYNANYHQNNQYYQQPNDYYTPNSYKLDVQIKPYPVVVKSETESSPVPVKIPPHHLKVNRFAQQFNEQHENLTKQFLEHKNSSTTEEAAETVAVVAPAPEILKKRRVAANARERRRMNNLNFAFDRYVFLIT